MTRKHWSDVPSLWTDWFNAKLDAVEAEGGPDARYQMLDDIQAMVTQLVTQTPGLEGPFDLRMPSGVVGKVPVRRKQH